MTRVKCEIIDGADQNGAAFNCRSRRPFLLLPAPRQRFLLALCFIEGGDGVKGGATLSIFKLRETFDSFECVC